jgi:hypothetical protein
MRQFILWLISGRLHATAFTYPHLTLKELILPNADLLQASFSRAVILERWMRLTALDYGVTLSNLVIDISQEIKFREIELL